MKIKKTQLPGLIVFEKDIFVDQRGYFFEIYSKTWFEKIKLNVDFVQDNVSVSTKGVMRGLHIQALPYTQAKFVQVLQGEVYDVVVDLRKDSPTFKKWHAEVLSESNKSVMFIPEGFAHGFLVLSESSIFHYKCSNFYNPESSKTIKWNDEEIGIIWPKTPTSISDRDNNGLSLKDYLLEN
jgi:dTDP-4-dehydrorhamnose 3,5-epimerase